MRGSPCLGRSHADAAATAPSLLLHLDIHPRMVMQFSSMLKVDRGQRGGVSASLAVTQHVL
jgi:hypothetical protein